MYHEIKVYCHHGKVPTNTSVHVHSNVTEPCTFSVLSISNVPSTQDMQLIQSHF